MEPINSDITKDNYITTGAGALTGAVGASCVINGRINHIAKNTVKALHKNSAECDVFVKKHEDLLTKASLSKRGFFGKINKLIKGADATEADIAKSTEETVAKYTQRALKKFSKKKGSAEKIAEQTAAFKDKLITKDVAKSIKSASKYKNILIILGASVAGIFLVPAIKDIANKLTSEKIIRKTENQIKKEEGEKLLKEKEAKHTSDVSNSGEVEKYIEEANNFKNLDK